VASAGIPSRRAESPNEGRSNWMSTNPAARANSANSASAFADDQWGEFRFISGCSDFEQSPFRARFETTTEERKGDRKLGKKEVERLLRHQTWYEKLEA
jgi:hypothetical protein